MKLTPQLQQYLLHPGESWERPLAIVDLTQCPLSATFPVMPPCPVIGVGHADHPLASMVDVVLEPPVELEPLVREIEAKPHAAAVIVQLLRTTQGLPLDDALTVESLSYGLLQGSEEYADWLKERGSGSASASAAPGRVILEREGSTLRVVLDRPEARNAINRHLRDELFEAFSIAALDQDVQLVQFRAIGPVFSAGGDLAEFGTTRDPAIAHAIRSRTLPARAIIRRPEIIDVHVQGPCIGAGLEMAAFARRVTAASSAWFQLPELRMGLLPGAGGCVAIPRRIGRQRAAAMILSGQRIDASTARQWGLIDAIVD